MVGTVLAQVAHRRRTGRRGSRRGRYGRPCPTPVLIGRSASRWPLPSPSPCPWPSCTCTSKGRWSRTSLSPWPRNGVRLRHADLDELRRAYAFSDLQSFLDLYYELTAVLQRPEDFVELAEAYLARAAAQGVRHAEVFVDPQAHTSRGVSLDVVMEG